MSPNPKSRRRPGTKPLAALAQLATAGGLMGASLKANVIDNDMLSADTLLAQVIPDTVRGEGHFLGQPGTFGRMKSDFIYPQLADRRSVEDWEDDGCSDIRATVRATVCNILTTHCPPCIPAQVRADLHAPFNISLPQTEMEPT